MAQCHDWGSFKNQIIIYQSSSGIWGGGGVCARAWAYALIFIIQYLRLFSSSICSWKNMCYSCLLLVASLCIPSQNTSYLKNGSVYMSTVLSQLTSNLFCLVFISIKALTIIPTWVWSPHLIRTGILTLQIGVYKGKLNLSWCLSQLMVPS